VNNNKDFDIEYLKVIYETIKSNEIILPEEHQTKHAYDHAWKELLVKIKDTPDQIICNTNIFDGDMFAATWKPIVATLSYVFMSASDDAVFSRVITGFHQCAQIAAKHSLHDALDQIIFCLSSISTLATGATPDTSLNTEVQANEKSVMVSEMAVKFGRDDRAQLATIVLFRVLAGNEDTVSDGWDDIIRIMLSLFVNSLIPATFGTVKHSVTLPAIPLQPPVQVIDRAERQNEGGLFSTLSSYVSSFTNDEPPEPSEQEIENTLCAIDCIKTCGIDDLLARLSQLPLESLRSVLESLLSQIPEDSSPRIIVVKSEVPTAASRSNTPVYDPSLVFVLELATILVLRDAETVEALGKDVADALQSVIRNAASYHYVVISRVTYYLLSLLRASDVSCCFVCIIPPSNAA
jgi:brefeldin A-resistance guanine nucleotide exchange factor 1